MIFDMDEVARMLDEYLRYMYGDVCNETGNGCKTAANFEADCRTYVVVAEYTYNGIECQILETIGLR